MEMAITATCAKAAPIVTAKVVPIVGAKLTSVLAGIGSSKIMLIGSGVVAGILSFIRQESQVLDNQEEINDLTEEEYKSKIDDHIYVQNVISNDLFIENKEKLSSYIEENAQIRREKIDAIIDAVNKTTLQEGTAFVTEQIVSCLIMDLGIGAIKRCAKSSAIPLAKLGKVITDKIPTKIPKAFSAIRQEIIDTLGNFTRAEHVAVTPEGAKVTVSNAQKDAQLLQSMEKVGETTKNIGAVEREFKPILKSVDGRSFLEIKHPVLDNIKTGSALKKDPFHAFNSIIDNFARYAKKFDLKGKDGIVRELYQIEGSLNGINGIFEWIVDPRADRGVTHRLFIKNGTITGIPNVY